MPEQNRDHYQAQGRFYTPLGMVITMIECYAREDRSDLLEAAEDALAVHDAFPELHGRRADSRCDSLLFVRNLSQRYRDDLMRACDSGI